MTSDKAKRWPYALAGALVVFGFLAGFTIGLPFLAAGMLLLLFLIVRRPAQANEPASGRIMVLGATPVLLVVGAMNLGTTLGLVLIALAVAALVAGRRGMA